MLKFNVFVLVLYIWFLLVLIGFVGCGVMVGKMIYIYRFKDFRVYLEDVFYLVYLLFIND